MRNKAYGKVGEDATMWKMFFVPPSNSISTVIHHYTISAFISSLCKKYLSPCEPLCVSVKQITHWPKPQPNFKQNVWILLSAQEGRSVFLIFQCFVCFMFFSFFFCLSLSLIFGLKFVLHLFIVIFIHLTFVFMLVLMFFVMHLFPSISQLLLLLFFQIFHFQMKRWEQSRTLTQFETNA